MTQGMAKIAHESRLLPVSLDPNSHSVQSENGDGGNSGHLPQTERVLHDTARYPESLAFSWSEEAVRILESSTDGFIGLDREWRIVYINAEAERLIGMQRHDVVGRVNWELFPGAMGSAFQREFLHVAEERVSVDFEEYYLPWERWFRVKAYPGSNGGVSVFFKDITDRKRNEIQQTPEGETNQLAIARDVAEHTQREAARLLAAIVGSSDDAIISKDLNGTVTSWNTGAERLFGYTAAEIVGKSILTLIPLGQQNEENEILSRLTRGERIDHFETVRRRKDGTLLDISLTISSIKDEQGNVVGVSEIAHDITETERAQRAALLLSAMVDSSDDAIISKDLNGRIMSWNKSAERLFGYTADEAVGKPITILIPPDRQDEEPRILARLKAGERVDHFETIRCRKDGALLDISLTISPIRDAQGKIIGASKIARDISERKRNERAIQALNAQLAAEVSALTRMQQLSTRLVQANDFVQLLAEIIEAGIEVTGADMGNIQLLEHNALQIAAQRGFEQPFLDFFGRVLAGTAACGQAVRSAQRVIVEDVAECPLFTTAEREVMLAAGVQAVQSTPLVSRSGKLLGVFSIHFRVPHRPAERELRLLDVLARQAADLTERKWAETDLLASEARFRQLADSMPQIVWTARSDGSLDYYNERWYEFTGFDHHQSGDVNSEPIFHPDDKKTWYETWYASVRTGTLFNIEYRLWDRLEQRWRWFIGRALPVRDAEGNITKWFGTCTDIDQQKHVEDELRRANQDLEQFAYSASHDLQEPLRSIKINSQLLTRRYGSKLEGQAAQFLEYLTEGASRMEALVHDLLSYTQVTNIEGSAGMTDANVAYRDALVGLQGSITQSGAVVTSDPLPAVRIHEAHLKQVFQNLIGNAIKYRSQERDPTVHLSASREGADWLFSVADNGIGIAPEHKERIFGLFKRLHTNEEYPGTGIGLALCQRIVERHHGKIWVESEPGQGSKFLFTLPIEG